MPQTNIAPVYALNSFIWKVLQEELGWTANTYGGKTPIIPAQQQPEFNNYPAPYLVYGYASEDAPGDLWIVEIEQAVYTIYATSAGDINKVLRTLNPALRRMDDSARDVNRWIHSSNNAAKSSFDNMSFLWTEVANVGGPGPADEEGGRMDGQLVVRYGITNPAPAENEYVYL